MEHELRNSAAPVCQQCLSGLLVADPIMAILTADGRTILPVEFKTLLAQAVAVL